MGGAKVTAEGEASLPALVRPHRPPCQERIAPPLESGLKSFLDTLAELVANKILQKYADGKQMHESTKTTEDGKAARR